MSEIFIAHVIEADRNNNTAIDATVLGFCENVPAKDCVVKEYHTHKVILFTFDDKSVVFAYNKDCEKNHMSHHDITSEVARFFCTAKNNEICVKVSGDIIFLDSIFN